ncbi:multidrug resistance-associated protein [Trypanosoma grayi]|uniref:multidrug resistance-associated protein n=1 Tax=Trypanosoma grayi TaxID=71804 RepID=UPI0004F473B5|nr:multidrug resistance-associated protein [Trypanosoma grayi]KEG13553.1 multidrug resistance-associated protein [Trypanosoma grayi]
MAHKGGHVDPSAVYVMGVVHMVLLWLAVALLLVSVVWFKDCLLRTVSRFFYYYCGFAVCVVILNVTYEIFCDSQSVLRVSFAWAAHLGAISWLLLVMRCMWYAYVPDAVVAFALLSLALTEWVCVALQCLSDDLRLIEIMFTACLAVPHTLAFVTLVRWDWLMVKGITDIFHCEDAVDPNSDDDQAFPLHTLPLSRELSVGVSCSEVQLDRGRTVVAALARRWGVMYAILALVRLLYDVGGLLPAYLLRLLVDNLMQANLGDKKHRGDFRSSVVLIFLIVACTLAGTFLRIHYNMKLQKMALYNRGVLTMELFRCGLCRRRYQFGDKTQGDIINHLSVDVQRVADAVQTLNDLWALPLQLAFALYLLYMQVSFAFLAGVAVTLVLIPLNALLAKRIKNVQTGLMRENDERVLTITEIVNNIVYVKMCGWSRMAKQWVEEPRGRYMKYLRWLKYLDAFCVFFWAVTPTLVSLLTFITFMWMGGQLTPGKAITALALFGMLISPLNAYPWVINGFVEVYVSWRRLQPFLSMPLGDSSLNHSDYFMKRDDNTTIGTTEEELGVEMGTLGEVQPLLQEESTIGYSYLLKQPKSSSIGGNSIHSPQKNGNSTLVDIEQGCVTIDMPTNNMELQTKFELRIPKFQASRGQLIVIVGYAGSGKSTFLNGLAGELVIARNSAAVSSAAADATAVVSIARDSMAYVEQQPFLMAGTLRENILFGHTYDPERYEAVMNAVALAEDIRCHFGPDGDFCSVGDRGGRLSGGQKVRVALARALYANKDVCLVDDILGCLDATVAHHVIREALVAAARRGCCVIAATHSKELIENADIVYTCTNGNLILIDWTTIATSLPSLSFARPRDEKGREESLLLHNNGTTETVEPLASMEGMMSSSSTTLESSERGTLAWGTLTCYLSLIGWGLTTLIVVSVVAMQAARNVSDQYVVVWSKNGNGDVATFLRVLGSLAVLNSVLALARGFSFAVGGLRAAQKLHDKLLCHVLSATFTFFSNTSPGRIINRLSSDIYTIDESLPFIANILLAQTFLLIGSVVIIILNSTAAVALALIPLAVLYYHIQRPYRRVSRELRRLEETVRAPLLDALRDELDGGVVMRSFGSDTVRAHLRRVQRSLDMYLRVQYNSLLLNAWFALRLELVGVLLLVLVGGVAVYNHGSTHAPMLGLALAYVQPLTSYLNGVLGAFTSTEKELISVERVRQYFELATEDAGEEYTPCSPGFYWPFLGTIEFTNVSMRYDADEGQVLHKITFHVEAGEKVAIVGRTGAGKSSIFAALLRLVCIEEGRITIDEIDINQLPLEVLRTRLGVLPQQPFIFHGTLRRNVDPFGLHTDDDIRASLACVGLTDFSLDLSIFERGNVSGGQRHQIAVARVLLQRSRVLLLDEPTSQSNQEAESSLWLALDAHLKGTTVLCITHKLTHIDFFDRIIVIDKGRVVKSGTPAHLRCDGAWPFFSTTERPLSAQCVKNKMTR